MIATEPPCRDRHRLASPRLASQPHLPETTLPAEDTASQGRQDQKQVGRGSTIGGRVRHRARVVEQTAVDRMAVGEAPRRRRCGHDVGEAVPPTIDEDTTRQRQRQAHSGHARIPRIPEDPFGDAVAAHQLAGGLRPLHVAPGLGDRRQRCAGDQRRGGVGTRRQAGHRQFQHRDPGLREGMQDTHVEGDAEGTATPMDNAIRADDRAGCAVSVPLGRRTTDLLVRDCTRHNPRSRPKTSFMISVVPP
ncbi:hypothetical protein [Pseudonocardia sp.]|jgi:hypothetical protein|uniref:hypothetical protein n=1 Tax=Pseudonocardia sp. TaxID=60912 RepID=UPI002602B591|nr:hypothetical protein [Pseudonocardia sp.]